MRKILNHLVFHYLLHRLRRIYTDYYKDDWGKPYKLDYEKNEDGDYMLYYYPKGEDRFESGSTMYISVVDKLSTIIDSFHFVNVSFGGWIDNVDPDTGKFKPDADFAYMRARWECNHEKEEKAFMRGAKWQRNRKPIKYNKDE